MHRRLKTIDLVDIALVARFPFSPGYVIVRLIEERLLPLLRKQEPFSAAVAEASSSLEQAARLVSSLQSEITERTRQLEQVMADYEKYKTLAVTKQEEARAFLNELNKQIGQSSRRERIWAAVISVVVALIFFAVGLLVSPIVGIGR